MIAHYLGGLLSAALCQGHNKPIKQISKFQPPTYKCEYTKNNFAFRISVISSHLPAQNVYDSKVGWLKITKTVALDEIARVVRG